MERVERGGISGHAEAGDADMVPRPVLVHAVAQRDGVPEVASVLAESAERLQVTVEAGERGEGDPQHHRGEVAHCDVIRETDPVPDLTQ